MAKCPKCSSRKGKRHCPGLGATICSACCGEYRFAEIDCPEDCVFLGEEPTHRKRRREKSCSQGRHFLKFLRAAVSNEREWRFCFRLFLEFFNHNQRHDPLTDAEVRQVLADLGQVLGRVILPVGRPHPLSVRIEGHCSDDPDLSTGAGFSTDDRIRVLRSLEKAVEKLSGGGATHRVRDLLDAFFGPLNLKADLGYDPAAASRSAGELHPAYRQRPSGLIVPP